MVERIPIAIKIIIIRVFKYKYRCAKYRWPMTNRAIDYRIYRTFVDKSIGVYRIFIGNGLVSKCRPHRNSGRKQLLFAGENRYRGVYALRLVNSTVYRIFGTAPRQRRGVFDHFPDFCPGDTVSANRARIRAIFRLVRTPTTRSGDSALTTFTRFTMLSVSERWRDDGIRIA